MTIGEAIERLRAHWGELHLDVGRSGVATVSNLSAAKRAWSDNHGAALKIYQGEGLEVTLASALRAEGLLP